MPIHWNIRTDLNLTSAWHFADASYWHVTSDPNFQINPEHMPFDTNEEKRPGLFVSQDPHYWASEFRSHPEEEYDEPWDDASKRRNYVAEINMPKPNELGNRGYGNEWFADPSQAQVKRVWPIQEGLNEFDRQTPDREQEAWQNLAKTADAGTTFNPVAPIDELTNYLGLQGGSAAGQLNPNNPMGTSADPQANKANPNMNPNMPGAFNNPSNPELNAALPGAATNPSNPQFNPSMPNAQNNPSNYQFNPQMPSAVNNPSSPELNPIYPDSWTNPSNPMHNPDYPNPEALNVKPPGLSPDASFPPGLVSTGRTWEPRTAADPWGRGRWPAIPPSEDGYYYHEAPTAERDRIQTHGLIPGRPHINERWDEAANKNFMRRRNDTGVYVTNNPGGAAWIFDEPMDTWRIPSSQVQDIKDDRAYGTGARIMHPVQPEMHEPYEMKPGQDHHFMPWHRPGPADPYMSVPDIGPHEEGEPGVASPPPEFYNNEMYDYFQQRYNDKPNAWGLGLPDRVIGHVREWTPRRTAMMHEARLDYTPGQHAWKDRGEWKQQYGRGLVAPDGTVHTWPEDQGTHMDMASQLGVPHDYDRQFAVDPEGQFRMNGWGSAQEALMPTVMEQTGFTPHPHYYRQRDFPQFYPPEPASEDPLDDDQWYRESAATPEYECPGCQLPLIKNGWTGFTPVTAEGYGQRTFVCPQCQTYWKTHMPMPMQRVAAGGHRLWWKPGQPGRAVMSPEGTLHTWPEDEMTHVQRLMQLGAHDGVSDIGEPYTRYSIRPNAAVPVFTPDEGAQLQAADPRLRPTISPFIYNKATQRGEPNPYYTPPTTSAWRFGEVDFNQGDSKQHADPTEPRPSGIPDPRGCTCDDGHKLDCPIHGMYPTVEDPDDMGWHVPENNPVGYPQGQPRGWATPYQSSKQSGTMQSMLTSDQVTDEMNVSGPAAYEAVGWYQLSPYTKKTADELATKMGVTLHANSDLRTLLRFVNMARNSW